MQKIVIVVKAPGGKEGRGGGWGTPYNGIYWEAPPERGTLSRFRFKERLGISQVQVSKRT